MVCTGSLAHLVLWLDLRKTNQLFFSCSRFLLKYTSRDEVEILNSGNGGITDARTNIEEYEDDSPLYGFLKYRRRNVVIKYLPEDSSRLIQGMFDICPSCGSTA